MPIAMASGRKRGSTPRPSVSLYTWHQASMNLSLNFLFSHSRCAKSWSHRSNQSANLSRRRRG
jgi:hypothetical protein